MPGWKPVLREIRRKVQQPLDAGLRDEIRVLDADSGREFRAVLAGLGGEDFAFLEDVVPLGVQVRELVRLEPDAVTEMMWHSPATCAATDKLEVLVHRLI